MKLLMTLFLTLPHPLFAQEINEIENKCLQVARTYAEEENTPWSSDARFGYRNKHVCTVIVSALGYDNQTCYPTYAIDLKSWKVTQLNFAGCIDQN